MIPQHSMGRANPENGVRYRAAACRQRLRNSRTTPRATNHSHTQAQSPDLTLLATELVDERSRFNRAPVDKMAYTTRSFDDCEVLSLAETEDSEKAGIT